MAQDTEFDQFPAQFARAIEQIEQSDVRAAATVRRIGAPKQLASYAYALSANIQVREDDLATGRFVLLHEPAGHDVWSGTFRCVMFAQAEVEPEMASDPLLPEVGWTWLTDALTSNSARHHSPGGSVTVERSQGFGHKSEDNDSAAIEIRGSWTPQDDLGGHFLAWIDLLCTMAGLPPEAQGVVPLMNRRASS